MTAQERHALRLAVDRARRDRIRLSGGPPSDWHAEERAKAVRKRNRSRASARPVTVDAFYEEDRRAYRPVIEAACAAFNVGPADLLSAGYGDRRAQTARQVAMVACKRSGLPYSRVGRMFGRDHSTVIFASRRVDRDPDLARTVRDVIRAAR